MKILAKSVAVAAIAMSVTGVAEARIQAIGDQSKEGSELLLNVVNYSSKTSYTLDLGVTVTQLMTPGWVFAPMVLNDSNFQSFAAAYTQGDNVTWGVSGGYGVLVDEEDLPLFGFYTTSVESNPAVFDKNDADVSNTMGVWNDLVSYIQTQDSNAANHSTFRAEGQQGYTAPYGNDFLTALPFIAQGQLGQSLAFVHEKLDLDVGDFSTTMLGIFDKQWNLSLSGNQGLLTYSSAVAPVPLPGAVWMFGTGLMAFLAANRRKAIAA